MKKSELIRMLEAIPGDPDMLVEDRYTGNLAREAQVVAEVYAVTDAAFQRDQRVFWEKDDTDVPSTWPGDDSDDPAPVIALVLR